MRAFANIKIECEECDGANAEIIVAPLIHDEGFLVIDRDAVVDLLRRRGWNDSWQPVRGRMLRGDETRWACPMCSPTPIETPKQKPP